MLGSNQSSIKVTVSWAIAAAVKESCDLGTLSMQGGTQQLHRQGNATSINSPSTSHNHKLSTVRSFFRKQANPARYSALVCCLIVSGWPDCVLIVLLGPPEGPQSQTRQKQNSKTGANIVRSQNKTMKTGNPGPAICFGSL